MLHVLSFSEVTSWKTTDLFCLVGYMLKGTFSFVHSIVLNLEK